MLTLQTDGDFGMAIRSWGVCCGLEIWK